MAVEIVWADAAVASLLEAVDYIARDSPSYAAALAVQAERVAASLEQFPRRGRIVREYRDPDVRELRVGNSYRLIYRWTHSSIQIVAFVHVARDLSALIDGAPS